MHDLDGKPKIVDVLSLLALAATQVGGAPLAPNPQEPHLRNVRQLTFGGQNAEAYWSLDGKYLTYQAAVPGYPDEQIFVMKADGSDKRLVSTGKGRCTCSYFSPDMKWIYFSSTHEKQPEGQPPVDMSKGYVWAINKYYSLYRVPFKKAGAFGTPEKLIDLGHYVAETTIAPNGKYMVWTTDADGDLEIYRSDLDGKNRKRLTNAVGYDGGPFISWDSKTIAFRRDSWTDPKSEADYRALLAEGMIRPTKLEIWTMDAEGGNKKQVTHLSCASFAPFIKPDNQRILFSSNYGDPKGREFDVLSIALNGEDIQRITATPDFDGFPMFTRNGKKLVFASNRNGKAPRETNLFVADWVD
jgi:TolB protein